MLPIFGQLVGRTTFFFKFPYSLEYFTRLLGEAMEQNGIKDVDDDNVNDDDDDDSEH